MRKFNFRLEKIKRYKEQLEQEKRMKLASERKRLFIEQEKLSAIMNIYRKYMEIYGTRKPGKLNLGQLIITKRYLDKLSSDIRNQNRNVRKAETDVAEAQNVYIEASKEKKKYEKLREKHLDAYLKESLKEQGRELDEFGAREKVSMLAPV